MIVVCTNIFYIFAHMLNKCDSKYCSCLYYSANALSRMMTRMADESFANTGLSSSYAFLLMIVNERPGIQPKEISIQMLLTPSTVTRLIEKLEFKGYLERKPVGRNTEVFPKKRSLELNEALKESWRNLFKKYSEILGEEQGVQLTSDIYGAIQLLE